VLLPAALTASNLGNGEHQYISCTRMTDLKNQFAVKYPGVSAGSSLYYILFPNFCNHILGYALSYNDYAMFSEKCTGNGMAVLYNKPASPTIPVDDFQCGRNNIIEVYERAGQAYALYIEQERQRFRNLYISKCLSTKADANIEGKQYEYHYTLYYYDQSGNLVKTIPPEGVRLLTEEQLKQVENIRKTGNAGCADDGIVKEEDLNATLNTFSSAVQSSSARSLELLLKNVDANTGSQVRFITPDHKYMYQAAIVKDKLWVELYSIQPGSSGEVEITLTNHATANIGTNISQKWSQVVVQSSGFAGSPWDLYFNGKKLNLLPDVSAPAYPFAWEIESGYTLPADDVTYLKHFRLYSNPLSPEKVSENYNNPCLSIDNTLPLIVWGRFESSSLCNPLTETASVPNPGALQVNGDLGIYQTNLSNVTNNFTVELWVNPQQPHEIDQESLTGTLGTNNQAYAIFPTHGGSMGNAGMGISVGTNGVSVYEHADWYMPAVLVWQGPVTGWTHVAVVYNNRMPSLYINGRLVRETRTQSSMTNVSPSYNFGYGGYGVMQGGIDEVRIWNVVRTAQEISDNYVQGVVPGSSTGLVGYWPMDPANGGILADVSCSRNDITLPASNYNWIAEGANITNIASAGDANSFIVPLHGMPTTYSHNSLNQVVKQNSPDGGTTRFWYDRLGKLVVSQNAEQLQPLVQGANSNRYSYKKYDAFDRIVEVGEKVNVSASLKEETARNNESLQAWMQSGQDGQITQTIYDEAPSYAPGLLTYLRKRVAASVVLDGALGSQRSAATYYSYDYIGNVKTLYQENQKLSEFDATTGIKRIDYEYDLVSGNTNKVKYQEGKGDQFFYNYRYDSDNKVVEASTSRDGLIWNTEVTYRYYLHGPLARTELGHNKVQGLDVAYNLQGWIKGINSQQLDASKDMAQDGYAGSNFSQVARDVLGFSLGYFENDYKPISTTANAFAMTYQPTPTLPDESGKNLYNGNIGNVTLALSKLDNGALKGYTYRYDQLNRLKQMRFHDLTGVGPGWGSNSIVPGLYQEDITYDGNGNIETYKRNGNAASNYLMDGLKYHYNLDAAGQKVNNKLRHVEDPVPSNLYSTDIDGQLADYYTYDNIGNLISEGGDKISWTLDKKIKQISNSGQTINYKYDAIGNRIVKIVEKGNTKQFTFYVRDPKGNVLSVYSKNEQPIPSANDKLKWVEQHLYGTRKLGLWHPNIEVTSSWLAPSTGNGQINIGEREYELSNHLGNVLATISDGKTGIQGSNGSIDYYEANVLTASDYYPFGMQMPGRTYNGGNYRYGFNGKENDNEVKGNGAQQDFGNRAYDTRIARFLSVDRLSATYPGSSPYNVSADNPILLIDNNGDNPGLPSHYIATAVIQKHTTAFMAIFLASNTSVFELYEYAVQGQQHKRRNLVGAVGEAVAYRRLLEDGGGLKSLLPFNHFNQYGPRKVERNTKLFLGRKEDGHQVDVQEVETVFYRKSTYGTRSMSTGIYYHNFEGTEKSIKEVHALLGERFEFHVNFEVKALNVTSDVGFLYSRMEYALGQAKLRAQGRHTAAVFITDLAAWQKVANDQTYGPQLKELFKNKGDNVYVRLFEGFYEETNNELEKIKETVIQADKEERARAAKGK
jgi:RHS repeat-associated protein